MNINELKQQINRVIGVKGDLRIQAWWMNKILNDILVYCDENGNNSISDELILNTIAKIDNIPTFTGTGTGSLVQTKEVETFVNEAPITENPLADISVDAIGDNSTVLNPIQLAKADSPISSTVSGIFISVNPLAPLKLLLPIFLTLFNLTLLIFLWCFLV